MASTDMTSITSDSALLAPDAELMFRGLRIGVAAAIAGAVLLAVAGGPDSRTHDELWYDADGRRIVQPESEPADRRETVLVPRSADRLYSDFRAAGYRLEDVRAGANPVPRVYVQAIPRDIASLHSIETRKQVFIKTMLPLILRVNEELRQHRTRIQELTARTKEGGALTASEEAWLDGQYQRHNVPKGDVELLLRRVDVIPPSLALAQAAEESGWGTSRFALEGRALFGQRTRHDAPGLVPAALAENAAFKVKSFDALLDGVRSYARNLNTHEAYTEFRRLRAEMRKRASSPQGMNSLRLVETLTSYSERGAEYVKSLQTIIRVNQLLQLDGAQLSDSALPLLGARPGA